MKSRKTVFGRTDVKLINVLGGDGGSLLLFYHMVGVHLRLEREEGGGNRTPFNGSARFKAK